MATFNSWLLGKITGKQDDNISPHIEKIFRNHPGIVFKPLRSTWSSSYESEVVKKEGKSSPKEVEEITTSDGNNFEEASGKCLADENRENEMVRANMSLLRFAEQFEEESPRLPGLLVVYSLRDKK